MNPELILFGQWPLWNISKIIEKIKFENKPQILLMTEESIFLLENLPWIVWVLTYVGLQSCKLDKNDPLMS